VELTSCTAQPKILWHKPTTTLTAHRSSPVWDDDVTRANLLPLLQRLTPKLSDPTWSGSAHSPSATVQCIVNVDKNHSNHDGGSEMISSLSTSHTAPTSPSLDQHLAQPIPIHPISPLRQPDNLVDTLSQSQSSKLGKGTTPVGGDNYDCPMLSPAYSQVLHQSPHQTFSKVDKCSGDLVIMVAKGEQQIGGSEIPLQGTTEPEVGRTGSKRKRSDDGLAIHRPVKVATGA